MSQVVRIQDVKNDEMLVQSIVQMLDSHQVFCFRGDLGAGKTTYIKSICKALGVLDETGSPSFSIVNEYSTNTDRNVLHFDLYRIKNEEELIDIGWYDYLDSNQAMFIEWPEKAPNIIPDDAIDVHIEIEPDHTRSITIQNPNP